MNTRMSMLVFVFVSFVVPVAAADSPAATLNSTQIKDAARAYKLSHIYPVPALRFDDNVCTQAACARLGNLACEDDFQFNQILSACKGNNGADCINAGCDQLGTFGCDQPFQVTQILNACRYNGGGDCLRASCDFLGNFGCTANYQVMQVAGACQGNLDGQCVREVCGRLSDYSCASMSQVTNVARNCATW